MTLTRIRTTQALSKIVFLTTIGYLGRTLQRCSSKTIDIADTFALFLSIATSSSKNR